VLVEVFSEIFALLDELVEHDRQSGDPRVHAGNVVLDLGERSLDFGGERTGEGLVGPEEVGDERVGGEDVHRVGQPCQLGCCCSVEERAGIGRDCDGHDWDFEIAAKALVI
jgi:hypothetical protein